MGVDRRRSVPFFMKSLVASPHRTWCLGLCWVAIAVVCGGCGVEQYDSRMQVRLKELDLEGKFKTLVREETSILDPAKASTIDVTFRRPIMYGPGVFNQVSRDPNDPNKTIPADRVLPPFLLKFPGYQLTYEEMRRTRNGMRPVSIFVGVLPTDPMTADQIVAEIKEYYKETQKDLEIGWTTEKILTPENTFEDWKSISSQTVQPFYTPGSPAADPLNGSFKLFMAEKLGHQIILAVRGPSDAAETTQAIDAVRVSLGTIKVRKKAGAK